MKKILALCLSAILLVSLFGCAGSSAEKAFSKDGFEITLTGAFKETTMEGYFVCYDSKNAAVFVVKEDFTLFDNAADMTANDYAKLVKTANASRNPSSIKTSGGIPSFEYTFENTQENTTYHYYTTFFKGNDAFWMVQFASKDSEYAEQKENFENWVKTVKVA